MVAVTDPFRNWLDQAQLSSHRLAPEQLALLHAVFRFRQVQGDDYYSTRLLSHFLLHCDCGLKVAQLARLLGLSRPTASRQQHVSSKQAIQQAHHRLDGRPYGKLLPRYAGPIAQFLFAHPDATRADLIDFIGRTFAVRVSRVALYKYLKKYGLGATPDAPERPPALAGAVAEPAPVLTRPTGGTGPGPFIPQGQPVPGPASPFSPHGRSTRGPSS